MLSGPKRSPEASPSQEVSWGLAKTLIPLPLATSPACPPRPSCPEGQHECLGLGVSRHQASDTTGTCDCRRAKQSTEACGVRPCERPPHSLSDSTALGPI